MNHLKKIGRTWEQFLFWGGFTKEETTKIKYKKRKTQRKDETPFKIYEPTIQLSFVLTRKTRCVMEK